MKLTEQEVADVKYAVAMMYRYSQSTNNAESIQKWGVLAEKLSTVFTNVGGYGDDEDFINQHLDGTQE